MLRRHGVAWQRCWCAATFSGDVCESREGELAPLGHSEMGLHVTVRVRIVPPRAAGDPRQSALHENTLSYTAIHPAVSGA